MTITPLKGAPLRPRDANRSSAAMVLDKQTPCRPALSASGAKAANKAPLTPRIAGSTTGISASPLTRRGHGVQLEGRGTPTTPVANFLADTITPRSSARRKGNDSLVHTPVAASTPTPVASDATVDVQRQARMAASLGRPRPLSAISASSSVVVDPNTAQDLAIAPSAKFFHASDAKSSASLGRTPQRPPLTSTSSFLYANGETIAPSLRPSTSCVGSTAAHDAPKLSSTISSDAHMDIHSRILPPLSAAFSNASPRLDQSPMGTTTNPRPTSPQRAFNPVNTPAFRPSPKNHFTARPEGPSRGRSTPDMLKGVLPAPDTPLRPPLQDRAMTLTTLHEMALKQRNYKRSSTSTTNSESSSAPTASIPRANIESGLGPHEVSPPATVSSPPQPESPVRTAQSMEELNELAANARRERKVLDLEITNSSLTAINRSLEREMRKQTAELRRFRRLSRSGRLSLSDPSSRKSTDALDAISEANESDADAPYESAGMSSDDSNASSDLNEVTLSPRAQAESDARHRTKDEKRLQLDLSKHQQLLVDSQKLNQSLKRCLGWTEVLITDGRKALSYKVHVSDVALGGHVLSHDDGNGDEDDGDDEMAASPMADVASVAETPAVTDSSDVQLGSFDRELLAAATSATDL